GAHHQNVHNPRMVGVRRRGVLRLPPGGGISAPPRGRLARRRTRPRRALDMSWYWALTLMLAAFMALLAAGLPVVCAFFAVNIGGALLCMGGEAGLLQLVRNAYDAVTNISLSPIPLFILMGEVMYQTGLAGRAIDAVDKLIARVPGRLSLVAIVS